MYLGEFPLDPSHKAHGYTPSDWAMELIEIYGHIDGAHHKMWVLDQVSRVLKGAPVTTCEARWDNHAPEMRFTVGTSPEYEAWVLHMRGEYDPHLEEYEYEYDEGTPP